MGFESLTGSKMQKFHVWRYRNTTLLVLSLLLLFLFADSEVVHQIIRKMGDYGYVGAFIAGIFFVSTFTVAPATVLLFHIAQEGFGLLGIALAAGAGSVLGDLLIFRFFRHYLFRETAPILWEAKQAPLNALFHSPHFGWLTPLLGALIIASPLPDELGIGFMGVTNISQWQFIILTYVLNAAGIWAVVWLAQAV